MILAQHTNNSRNPAQLESRQDKTLSTTSRDTTQVRTASAEPLNYPAEFSLPERASHIEPNLTLHRNVEDREDQARCKGAVSYC